MLSNVVYINPSFITVKLTVIIYKYRKNKKDYRKNAKDNDTAY